MIQLSDMANFFESTRNFYEWRKPLRTGASVGVLAISIIACVFIPTWLLIKVSTLSAGFSFFALFPLLEHSYARRMGDKICSGRRLARRRH
jgi:hypothetical protein